jgi:MFS family permease
VAYDSLQTLFTSYAVDELGISEDFAPTLGGIAGLTFLLFAIPAGFIGAKFSRRRTIMFGLVTFAALMVIAFFIPDSARWNLSASFAITKVHLIGMLMGLGGLGWAMVNINSLPMVVDTVGDVRLLGTYTGLYYLASQSGSSLGPFLIATVIELLGGSYNNIFLAAPLFFVLALAAMFFVTRGSASAGAAPAVNTLEI